MNKALRVNSKRIDKPCASIPHELTRLCHTSLSSCVSAGYADTRYCLSFIGMLVGGISLHLRHYRFQFHFHGD